MSVILDIEIREGWVGIFDMTGSKSKIADPDFALTWIQRGYRGTEGGTEEEGRWQSGNPILSRA